MNSKTKKSLVISGIAGGLIAAPIVLTLIPYGIQKALTKNDIKINEETMRETFTNLLNTTHGRKAGDLNNFKKEVLNYDETRNISRGFKLEGDQKVTTSFIEQHLLYKLNDEANPLNPEHSNYGSYLAYQYLKQQIMDMGYEYRTNGEITYPDYPQSPSNAKVTIYTEEKDAATVTAMKENLKLDGFFTQGFLFSTRNSFNNVGNNLVVTINPSEKVTKDNTVNVKDFYIVSHYDSANNVGPNGTSWGATDNASGVSVNLALLKHFSDIKNRDNLGVRLHLIFVDAEEVGKLGSIAFVNQFLAGEENELLSNSLGMINMDTVAGGDHMYIHSPDTNTQGKPYNTSPLLRNFINNISKERAEELKDADQELKIHPQFVEDEYKAGETGDWSDHAPFYQIAKLPVAYVESTNFGVKSKYNVYDGYSQTINPKAWVLKDGTTIESLKERKLENGEVVYDWPDGMKKEDFAIMGDIWHSDLDTLAWINENVGPRFYKQLNTVFHTLKTFLEKLHTINEDNTISYPEFNQNQ
ncbi:M28 family metallopeptidase [Metamycoplasma gateae]|uniref:M28 family peptidase n=1 Tax=Metamycoplasma gateae TaxID=35769 RepID=A0ABZ2AHR1_9BACT|nr:M28 family peptidase [Metamycoplasma gateae]